MALSNYMKERRRQHNINGSCRKKTASIDIMLGMCHVQSTRCKDVHLTKQCVPFTNYNGQL